VSTYWFTLIMAGKAEFTDDEAEVLFEAGCDDGTLVSRSGVASIGFAREADSLLGAIRSAIRDVRKAGFEPARVEIETDVIEDAAPEHQPAV
jgi:hypothetical protein